MMNTNKDERDMYSLFPHPLTNFVYIRDNWYTDYKKVYLFV